MTPEMSKDRPPTSDPAVGFSKLLADAEREYDATQLECKLWRSRVNNAQVELEAAEKRREIAGGKLWELQKRKPANEKVRDRAT